MFHKKTIIGLLIFGLLMSSFILINRKSQRDAKKVTFTIGILQTASHPALDAAREGFIQTVQHELAKDVEFIIQNAQGSVSNAHTIAQSFHTNNRIDAIFAIATPALQAMAAVEKHKPIFFAAVTDPKALDIMTPTTNICGSSDMINIPDTVIMLKELVPTAQTVALLYNTAEVNSAMMADAMRRKLQKNNLIPVTIGFTSEADLMVALMNGLQKADVILAPTDNTVASAIDLVAAQALRANKPLIVSDNLLVEKGALAARGVDYKNNGRQAGQLAIAVLKGGKKPYELPVAYTTSNRIIINKATLNALNLTIPESLQDQVTFVGIAQAQNKDK